MLILWLLIKKYQKITNAIRQCLIKFQSSIRTDKLQSANGYPFKIQVLKINPVKRRNIYQLRLNFIQLD